jgi:hypothetical protein
MLDYYDDELTLYGLVRDLFIASSITCFLWAAHRVGNGLMLAGRVAAYNELAEAYTPEEREVLIHRIKASSLKY